MSTLSTGKRIVPALLAVCFASGAGAPPQKADAPQPPKVAPQRIFSGLLNDDPAQPQNWTPFGVPGGADTVLPPGGTERPLPGGVGDQRAPLRIPPGFEIVQLTDDPSVYDYRPKINNRGQIVFTRWYVPGDHRTKEILLYDRGRITRLTNDYVGDALPDINDDGTIVWTRSIGPPGSGGEPTSEIVVWRDGQLTRLTDNTLPDGSASINNLGQVVWKQMTGTTCGLTTDIWMYDGQRIFPITTNSVAERVAHQGPEINDPGQIVWTRYNFCPSPYWESDILMYDNGVTTRLTSNQVAPSLPDINNAGLVAWFHRPPTGNSIELWQSGVTTLLTDWGANPQLNNLGDVAFHRWHETTQTWQQWLFTAGRFWQLSDDSFWNADGDINDEGEVVWQSRNFPRSNIRYMRRAPTSSVRADSP